VTQTQWTARDRVAPLRAFLRMEAAGAGLLLLSIATALVWANLGPDSYEGLWRTELSLRLGDHDVAMDLREWVNSGLMTLFFLVVGLEARREVDLGELRDRKRFVLPLVAGLLGMALPVAIFLAVNRGTEAASGWGVAMSTDTALALGFLSLLRTGVSERMRVFLLTVFVVDDLVALLVIAVFYSDALDPTAIGAAVLAFAVFVGIIRLGVDQPLVYALVAVAVWAALLQSGVDPVVAGLVIGLAASAYSPSRDTLETASRLFRRFREEPTAELARTASVSLTGALSPNARLQRFYVPWTVYLIVPLFGLANAGFPLGGGFLADAVTSRITLGIVAGYVVGKPVAVVGGTWLVTRLSGGTIRAPLGWAAVAGSGTIAGTGFTVSLLIATLAFSGRDLAEAKVGVLAAGALSVLVTAVVFRLTRRLPHAARARALVGRAEQIVDLAVAVDPERDHVRGNPDARVTLVEYGDFECPNCGEAEPATRAELADDQDLRFVWRHLPLTDVHPRAQLAAEASEAAARQGRFWEMHDLLLERQDALTPRDLASYAAELGLDVEQFHRDLVTHAHADRIVRDVDSADLSSVSGTPTFFVNGLRHYGAYDLASLRSAIKLARARVFLEGSPEQA
jgi:Na+/H+ antiporter NhaA